MYWAIYGKRKENIALKNLGFLIWNKITHLYVYECENKQVIFSIPCLRALLSGPPCGQLGVTEEFSWVVLGTTGSRKEGGCGTFITSVNMQEGKGTLLVRHNFFFNMDLILTLKDYMCKLFLEAEGYKYMRKPTPACSHLHFGPQHLLEPALLVWLFSLASLSAQSTGAPGSCSSIWTASHIQQGRAQRLYGHLSA